jgi:hypothetical protein
VKAAAAAVDPKLVARRQRAAERQRAARATARQAKAGSSNGSGASGGNSAKVAATAQALWRQAEALAPKTPWRAIAREFGTNEAQALDAYRTRSLQPGMTASAIERFLELPA